MHHVCLDIWGGSYKIKIFYTALWVKCKVALQAMEYPLNKLNAPFTQYLYCTFYLYFEMKMADELKGNFISKRFLFQCLSRA